MPKVQSVFSLLFLLVFLLSGLRSTEAQTGAPISGQAITPTGTPAYNAQLFVCAYNASGIPCYPQVPIYYSSSLSGSPITQPISTDAYGNYNVWTTKGTTVLVQIKINATTTYSYYQAAGGSGSSTGCTPSGTTGFFLYINNTGGCTGGYIDYGATTASTLTLAATNITGVTTGKTLFTAGNGFQVNENSSSGIQLTESGTGALDLIASNGGIALSSNTTGAGIALTEYGTGAITLTAPRINLTSANLYAIDIAPGSGGPDCLQIASTGQISNTGSACGSGGGGSGGIPALPIVFYPVTQTSTSQIFVAHPLSITETIPSGCTGSAAKSYPTSVGGTAPVASGSVAWTFRDLTTSTTLCTFTWSASGSVATVSGSGGTINPGDDIAFVGTSASTGDATLAQVGAIINGTTPGGGGSSITVNGGAALSVANFGNSPAAGAGFLNVTWQVSAPNISAEVPIQGTDSNLLTAGTVSGTGSLLCTDSNGGATTTGCGGGTTTNALTMNNNGTGAIPGSTFNGSAAITLSYNTLGAAPTASPTFSGTMTLPITGSTQCLHVSSSGILSGTGADCGVTNVLFSSLASSTNTTAAMVVGSGASLTPTGSGAIGATTVYGGALGSVLYQSAANSTAFLAGVTTSGHAFFLGEEPSGALIAPQFFDLGSYLGTNVTGTSPITVTPTTLGFAISCSTCATSATGTTVSVNGGSTLGSLNINGTTPSADSNYLALLPKISGSNMIIEAPYGTGSAFGVLECGSGTSCSGGVISVTGSGTTTNSLTMNNGGSGATSGSVFNGSAAITLSYNTLGAAPAASPTFTGTVTLPITGSTQCLQVNSSGAVSGSGASCAVISGQTAGYAIEAASATTATGPFPMDDSITTASTITMHKNLSIAGSGSSNGLILGQAGAITAVSGYDNLWADSGKNHWAMNANGGATMYPAGALGTATATDCVAFASNGIDIVDSGAVCGGLPVYGVSGVAQTSPHIVRGTATIGGGGTAITLSGSAIYTSSSSYTCTITDVSAPNATGTSYASGSSFSIYGNSGDSVRFVCTGN